MTDQQDIELMRAIAQTNRALVVRVIQNTGMRLPGIPLNDEQIVMLSGKDYKHLIRIACERFGP